MLASRREKLRALLPGRVVVLFSGELQYRNYPSVPWPFRPSSHVRFLCGFVPPESVFVLTPDEAVLFRHPRTAEDEVWEGPGESAGDLQARCDLTAVKERAELEPFLRRFPRESIVTVPVHSALCEQERVFGRRVTSEREGEGDRALAAALVELRLVCDEAGLREVRDAAALTVKAHTIGAAAVALGKRAREVLAPMEAFCRANGVSTSFQPTLSVRGEILHNGSYSDELQAGDLFLVDFGVESRGGYAGDITRVWPVSGKFAPTQEAVYRTVLAAQHRAIQMIRPGVRYRDVHLAAATMIAEGLYDLGVFRSQPGEGRTAVLERVVREGLHAAFFPHGVGHLLGLDVHDMCDLGDLSGYERGSVRSEQFGLHALRLDRTLRAGMVLTVEPGIYCNPSLLRHPRFAPALAPDCEARLTGVRGIRIEDDVLVTETGAEVLTQALPSDPAAVCALVGG